MSYRIKDIPNTASTLAADDYVAIDGATNNGRKFALKAALDALALPSQGGNTGKFLTTDGTTLAWGTVTAPVWGAITGTLANQTDLQAALNAKADALPSQTGNSGKFLTTNGSVLSWGTVTAPAWGNITGTLANQTDLAAALAAKAALAGAAFTGDVSTTGNFTVSGAISAATSTNLSLNGGSSGANMTLGQGANGWVVITPKGTGTILLNPNAANYDSVFVKNSNNTGYSSIVFVDDAGVAKGYVGYGNSGATYYTQKTYLYSANSLVLSSGAFAALTLDTAQNALLTPSWTGGATFTALKVSVTDTSSAAGSLLLDLQVGGTSKVKVDKDGFLTAQYVNAGARVVFGSGSGGIFWNGSSMNLAGAPVETDQNFWLRNSSTFLIIGGSSSPQLTWDANYTIGQRNGTNAQLYKLYNTYTSATNYERLGLNWATNVAQIYTEKGSGGGTARDLVLGTNATTAITISGTDQSVTTAAALSDSIGNVRSVPQNAQTAAYTLQASDNGKHISITTGGVKLPTSGTLTVGQVVTIYNNSSSNQTIDATTNSATMYQAGTTNTGNRTLASYGVATILCVATNTFVITGSGLS